MSNNKYLAGPTPPQPPRLSELRPTLPRPLSHLLLLVLLAGTLAVGAAAALGWMNASVGERAVQRQFQLQMEFIRQTQEQARGG